MGTFQVVIPAQAGIHEKYWIPDQVRNDRCSFPESRYATCFMLSLIVDWEEHQFIDVVDCMICELARDYKCSSGK
jgi:hypothetical protein